MHECQDPVQLDAPCAWPRGFLVQFGTVHGSWVKREKVTKLARLKTKPSVSVDSAGVGVFGSRRGGQSPGRLALRRGTFRCPR